MTKFRDADWDTLQSKEMLIFLDWFCKNTTDKIFRRMDKLGIDNTGALRNSIRATVYNNAGGNQAMVRFYYLAYGRFIEMALGHNRGADRDLIKRDAGGRVESIEGIKVRNREVPAITSWDSGPITPTFQGATDSGINIGAKGKNTKGQEVDRATYHKARPFLMSSITAEMRRIAFRMAERLSYFGAIQLTQQVVGAFEGDLENGKDYSMLAEAMDKPWLIANGWDIEHSYNVQAYIEGTLSNVK